MFAEERQQKIYDMICQEKSMRVQQLSKLLNISEVTIRRDLEELHKQKKIIRTHGGAMAYYPVGKSIKVPELMADTRLLSEKRAIAAAAYQFINDYDTILLDGSSTVYELVKLLAENEKEHLIIITTSPHSVVALAGLKTCQVIVAGGTVNYAHNTVEGHIANKFIQDIRVDKCFIGINGVDEDFGYSTPRFEDAEIKMLAVAAANQSFILTDRSKFGKMYLARVNIVCDYLITDSRQNDYPYEALNPQTTVVFANEFHAGREG
ncbi:MAG TPA: DeoR/GlpR family DNA-binding transcription regulator [Feifaniaceae bacterium]|nr:DeoR/GlpR family DNA-binding transcription regulator [Feifaniaceae bacterium]